jgi:hypothetical protein
MDSLTSETKIYPVQAGCRYAFAYISTGGTNVNLSFRDAGINKNNLFTLADGSQTTSGTIEDGDGGGWEILAPTSDLVVVVTGAISVSLVRVEN